MPHNHVSTWPYLKGMAITSLAFLLIIVSACSSGKTAQLENYANTAVQKTLHASIRESAVASTLRSFTQAPSPSPTLTPSPSITTTLEVQYVQAGKVQVPILLYHHIAPDATDNRYFVAPEIFDAQMSWLQNHGYHTITISRLADVIRHGGELPLRPVVITFDDGDADLYSGAFPILKKHGMIAVAYLISKDIDKPEIITSSEVKELIAAGWEIGSHSATHPELTKDHSHLVAEIYDSKIFLEDQFKITVNSFSYPFGLMDDAVFMEVVDSGYTSAVGLGEDFTHTMKTIYYLQRLEIEHKYSLDDFISMMPWN